MDFNLFSSVLNVPVLFFFLGMIATFIKSDLDIPQPIPKFLSFYLLFAIGFKGGIELSHGSFNMEVLNTLTLAIAMGFIVPIYSFFILKKRMGIHDAGAIAATYGSISAVTFVTAVSFLESSEIHYGGHMVAAMALMESPAIIVGVFLIRYFSRENSGGYGSIIKEAITNGSVVLILGSLIIGMLASDNDINAVKPFTHDIFKGMLAFFLLDMGILAGKRINSLKQSGLFLIAFAFLMPLFNAFLGLALCSLLAISFGNSLLLIVLFASASYIAVPAAMRIAVPEANPGIYVSLSMAITFPFNIVVGIPLYFYLLNLIN